MMRAICLAAAAIAISGSAIADNSAPLLLRNPLPSGFAFPKALGRVQNYAFGTRIYLICLDFVIEADGTTSNINVYQSTGRTDLDRSIVGGYERRRYSPATINGVPVAIRLLGKYIIYPAGSQPTGGPECPSPPNDPPPNPSGDSAPQPAIISPMDAAKHIGQTATVEGVASVYDTKGGTVWVDLGGSGGSAPFTGAIPKDKAGLIPDVTSYDGETVDITGTIKDYMGQPEIIISEPGQLKAK